MLQKICNNTCAKKKSTFITNLIKKFLVKIPLILLLNRASQWKNWWKNVSNLFFLSQNQMRFCFSIVKTMRFLSRGTNLPKICPKYTKIYCKSAQKKVV